MRLAYAPEGRQTKTRLVLLEAWVSVVVNVLLFASKVAIGMMANSVALLADAVHSVSDALSSLVLVVSAKIGSRPPDAEHPWGHGRSDAIAALIVSVLLGVAAIEFGKESVIRLFRPGHVDANVFVLAILVGTLVMKGWLSYFAWSVAVQHGGASPEADMWHHVTDVLATVVVLAALLLSRKGMWWVDGVGGLLLSLLVGAAALRLVRQTSSRLLGQAADQNEVEEIKKRASAVKGVMGVHDVVIHDYGQHRNITLHVEVSSHLSADQVHRIADRVERTLGGASHGSVVVHADPLDTDHPRYEEVARAMAEAVGENAMASTFHDLRLVGSGEQLTAVVDVIPVRPLNREERRRLVRELRGSLLKRLPDVRLVVYVEPPYAK